MSVQEFSSKRTRWLTMILLFVGASALIAWGGVQIFAEIPFEAEWASSGHADATAEAFTLSSEIRVSSAPNLQKQFCTIRLTLCSELPFVTFNMG